MRASTAGWDWLIATLLLAVLVAAGASSYSRERARRSLADQVLGEARLRAALFDREVARYRLLPLALQDDRDVVAAIDSRPDARRKLDHKLEALATQTGARIIYVIGPGGIAISASNWRSPTSFVGTDYRFRRYWRDAHRIGSAEQFAYGIVTKRPGLFLSRRTAGGGVVVVKLAFDAVEADWVKAGGDTFVRDPEGLVLVSSRPDWRFALTRPLSRTRTASIIREASVPQPTLAALPAATSDIEVSVPTATPGWTLSLRRPLAPMVTRAGLYAGTGAGLAILALGGFGWGLHQRAAWRRRRTTELEEAVAQRTAALTREMEERAASDARAATLREGLRQANRLATLGQVTAGVAHETAQPVAAIRNYAAASAMLLRQGDAQAVLQNLDTIARLSDRIGTVTSELRGFSRRRTGTIRPVPLLEVVDGALLILKEQLRGVSMSRPPVDPSLTVSGGRIRLEQVLVNIIQNALEALQGRPDPELTMTLSRLGPKVVLGIIDNGPGIDSAVADRLFTPFVTSREDGLGLGLVIAHDIMAEFGGTLRLVPTNTGAHFEIVMVAA